VRERPACAVRVAEAIEAALPAGLALVGAYGASSWLAAAEVTRSLGGGNAQRWGATPISARMEPGSAQVDWSHGTYPTDTYWCAYHLTCSCRNPAVTADHVRVKQGARR
jgi:hypothetical protein